MEFGLVALNDTDTVFPEYIDTPAGILFFKNKKLAVHDESC